MIEPVEPALHAAAPLSPAPQNRIDWRGEVKGVAVLLVAVLGFHSFVAKPFYIPSESMMPVLLKGDRLVVSKFAYGWSTVSPTIPNPVAMFRGIVLRQPVENYTIALPPLKGRLLGRVPERGDVVIAVPSGRNVDYIKRVIGVPGDLIEVRGGTVILNGTAVPQQRLAPLRIPVDANADCPQGQFPSSLRRDANGNEVCEIPLRRETLPNGRSYAVIDVTPAGDTDYYGPVRVPAGHVFLMGDNRDNSADSRVPLDREGFGGPVPVEQIGGRAEFITFSLNGSMTLNPASWWNGFRGSRAGNSLHPDAE